jgi:hypothetical protein
MKTQHPILTLLMAAVLCSRLSGGTAAAEDAKPIYENNFETTEAGKVPDDFLVIDGTFAVKQEGTNKFLELPGEPLDNFGIVFGPTVQSDVSVFARIRGTKKGRRQPIFAIGLNGQSGYKLQVTPAKGFLEIIRDDASVTNIPFEWKSGEWTHLKMQVTKAGESFRVEGKAWSEGNPEPEKYMIGCESSKDLPKGRPSIWGSPISTTPIQFDDLVVKKL